MIVSGDNLIDRFSLVVVREARRKARRLNSSRYRRREQRRNRERERKREKNEKPVGKIRLTDYKYPVYLYASLIVPDDKHLPITAFWLASLTNFTKTRDPAAASSASPFPRRFNIRRAKRLFKKKKKKSRQIRQRRRRRIFDIKLGNWKLAARLREKMSKGTCVGGHIWGIGLYILFLMTEPIKTRPKFCGRGGELSGQTEKTSISSGKLTVAFHCTGLWFISHRFQAVPRWFFRLSKTFDCLSNRFLYLSKRNLGRRATLSSNSNNFARNFLLSSFSVVRGTCSQRLPKTGVDTNDENYGGSRVSELGLNNVSFCNLKSLNRWNGRPSASSSRKKFKPSPSCYIPRYIEASKFLIGPPPPFNLSDFPALNLN